MTSKPNVIVVQKTTGKGTTIQGLPGKNVVTTLLNAGVSKTLKIYGQMTDCANCCALSAKVSIKSQFCMSFVADTACLNFKDVRRTNMFCKLLKIFKTSWDCSQSYDLPFFPQLIVL